MGEQGGGGENWFSSSRLPVPLASESDKIRCIRNGIGANCSLKRPRAREVTQWSITWLDYKRPYAPSLTTCPKTKNCGFFGCFGREGDPLAPSLFVSHFYLLPGRGDISPRECRQIKNMSRRSEELDFQRPFLEITFKSRHGLGGTQR